ncbi:MAG: hypothetical protein IAF02_04905 [Anaerolineae bacterium]|nr:hypothetical protein [Anaerolineae bacterium]
MRFLIHEQPYEKPIMAGEYRYELDGQPTGAVESWRLTSAAEGYRFLRVDLDARAAASGHTYLYHALVNAAGQVERLQFRFWTQVSGGLQVAGDVVLDETAVSATRTVNGKVSEQVLELPKGYRFWFPSVAGLHFAGWRGAEPKTAVTLNGKVGDENTLAIQVVDFEYFMMITDFMEMEAAGRVRQYVPCKLSWGEGNWRIIQRDADNGWPLGMMRDDGLTAVASRYIRYS